MALIHLHLGGLPTIVVSSARLTKEVMKYQDLNFCSSPCFVSRKKLSYDFSDLTFVPYGEYWKEMRKVSIITLFSTKRIQSFASIREEEVGKSINSISESCSASKPINLSRVLLTLTSNIICRVAFGKCYMGKESEKTHFHRAFHEAQVLFVSFFVEDYVPWLGWINKLSGQRARLSKNYMDLDVFYEQVIDEHMDPKRTKTDQEDFVDILLQVQKELNLTRSGPWICDERTGLDP